MANRFADCDWRVSPTAVATDAFDGNLIRINHADIRLPMEVLNFKRSSLDVERISAFAGYLPIPDR
ncbi:MAG TPA: hypothetical protein VFW28_16970 [Micropepsaceae bacterium]|nr:hypothetical protein [Micropepsaceae bacterium]